jgi:CheY-like chemotaxis protein
MLMPGRSLKRRIDDDQEFEAKLILVVEDDPLNLKLVKTLLELEKFRVETVDNAEKGIYAARRHLPDLILMDIQLPGMNGLEAVKLLKADEATRHIKVVALSAYAMQKEIDAAKSAGCIAYLTKPMDMKTFIPTINELLAQS